VCVLFVAAAVADDDAVVRLMALTYDNINCGG